MSTTKNFAATKVVIPCRISFANIWEPKSINGSEEKYSVSCLVRKTDKATLDRLQKAIDAAIEDGKTRKWGGKVPPNLKLRCATVTSIVRTMITIRASCS